MIRWGYVASKFLQVQTYFIFSRDKISNKSPYPNNLTIPIPQVLGSLFYAYYVFVRLCIPQFHSTSLQLFDPRAMVLCVFNSILPGEISHLYYPCITLHTSLGHNVLRYILVVHQSHFITTFSHLQEFWFSSWHSLPSSTVGLMLLPRCSALLTGCFTRYLCLRHLD